MAMSPDSIASIAGAVATGGFAVWTARAARRTPRQERRDDFVAVTEQQGKAIERLETRVQQGETKAELQQERLAECDEAIAWLLVRIRDLVSAVRKSGAEPPAPRPMSPRAAHILERSDV